MVGIIRVSPHGAFLAKCVLIVTAWVHEAKAHFADGALLAVTTFFILVVAVNAFADSVVGLHAGRQHALKAHTLLAWLAWLRGTQSV